MPTLTHRILSSALWAAYGDALGFIAEGVDERGLQRRLHGAKWGLVPWRRRLGYQGPDVDLPAGTYSDDTQLRLATGRSIGEGGIFDVDAFSRIELPLWPQYAVGAGQGSLDAARRLGAGKQRWDDLVSGDRSGRYVKGGGNGAVMRIQPITWAAPSLDAVSHDVLVNTATTHGNPKAFVGTLFHAHVLRKALESGTLPDVDQAREIMKTVRAMVDSLPLELGTSWQKIWSSATASSFPKSWGDACSEIEAVLGDLEPGVKKPVAAYRALLESQNLFADEERGSATKTSAVAYAALVLYSDAPTDRIIKDIASIVGSDTDSIATMAGALLGAVRAEALGSEVQDQDYITSEAHRLAAFVDGSGALAKPFPYLREDIRQAPARVVWDMQGARLGGLGRAIASGSVMRRGSNGEPYQWHRLMFGQTILLGVPAERARTSGDGENLSFFGKTSAEVHSNPRSDIAVRGRDTVDSDPQSIAAIIAERGFDVSHVGRAIMSAARRPQGPALAALIAYEVARLALSHEARQTAAKPDSPKPEVPRDAPKPTIQLQLNAKAGEIGAQVLGMVSNYGRSAAFDLRVQLGHQDTPILTYSQLEVKQTHTIDLRAPMPLVKGMPVVVYFRNGEGNYRQDGVLEPASGVPDALLLKGLGDVKLIQEERRAPTDTR